MKINLRNFYLFSVPVDFDISNLKILYSNHLVIIVEYEGKKGTGEGVLYKTSLLKALTLLHKNLNHFFQQEFISFKQARIKLWESFKEFPGLVCAFDLALWDLEAKTKKYPVSKLFTRKKRELIPVAEQIFIPKNKISLIRDVKEILSHKTELLKLKGGRNLEEDLKNIKLINEISKNKLKIQLDLNKSLTLKQAIFFGNKIKKLGIIAWEEPISFSQINELRILRNRIKIPIILDESIINFNDLEKAIKAEAIDILNVKINRLGGLTNSLVLIKLAKKNKIQIEIGCNEELGVATVGQMHLANYVTNLRILEALGSNRLSFDIIKEKIVIKNGFLKSLTKKVGIGVNFEPYKLSLAGRKYNFGIIKKNTAQPSLLVYTNYFKTRIKSQFINASLLLRKKIFHLCQKN